MARKFALVTGACGFIGSHMVDYLISQGYKVRASDISSASKNYLNPKTEFVPADITKIEEIYPLLKNIDTVFHVAAIYDFSCSRDILYKVNVGGTENLLKAARDFPRIKRIIIWSTGAFYDSKYYNLDDFPGMQFSEESPVRPKNFYELTKLEQEKVALKYFQKYNLPITVIRPATVYGPRSQYGAALIVLLIGKGQLSFIPGKGDKSGATVHVLDIVRAAEFLSKKSEAIGEIYNVSDDSKCPIKELFHSISKHIPDTKIYCHIPLFLISLMVKYSEWLAKIFGKKKPKLERGAVEYIFNPFLMDNRKIKKLGFELAYPDIKKGIKEAINWYRKEAII